MSRIALYHAYFASLHVAVSKQKVYRCCKNSPEKSECDKRLNFFCTITIINFLQCGNFSEFLELGKYDEYCILYRLYCFGRLLLCLHCLYVFSCLMILFEDGSIKYEEKFSMQCQIIILVIFYSRE